MFFWIWVILGTGAMSSVVAPPSPNRDYMNNIGIICSYDKTLVPNFNILRKQIYSLKYFIPETMDPCIHTSVKERKLANGWMLLEKNVKLYFILMDMEKILILTAMMVSIPYSDTELFWNMISWIWELFNFQAACWNHLSNLQKVWDNETTPALNYLHKVIFFSCVYPLAFLTDNQTVACAFDFVHKKNARTFKMLTDYRSSVLKRVPFAAKMISNVASEMYMRRILNDFKDLQLIGFSLGAHIAGKVGRLLRTAYGIIIPRIFGNFHNFFNSTNVIKSQILIFLFIFGKLLTQPRHLLSIQKMN